MRITAHSTAGPALRAWISPLLLPLAALASAQPAQAQCYDFPFDGYLLEWVEKGGAFNPMSQSEQDSTTCLNFAPTVAWSGNCDPCGGSVEDILSATHLSIGESIDYRDQGTLPDGQPDGIDLWPWYKTLTWMGTPDAQGLPMPAAVVGVNVPPDQGEDQTLITSGTHSFTTNTVRLVNTHLILPGVKIRFRGADSLLSFQDSYINLSSVPSNELTEGPLRLSVTPSGQQFGRIKNWSGRAGGPIQLDLGGQAFTFEGCGTLLANSPDDQRLWWSDAYNDIRLHDGSLMRIQESYLVVRTISDGGVQHGRLEVTGGSTLELRVAQSGLQTDSLELSDGGVLDLGNQTILTGRSFPSGLLKGVTRLAMDDGHMIVRESATAYVSNLDFHGDSQVELSDLATARVAQLFGNPGSSLSISGSPGLNDPALLNLDSEFDNLGITFNGGNIFVGPGITLGVGDPAGERPISCGLINGVDTLPPPILWVPEGARLQVYRGAGLGPLVTEAVPPVFDVSGEFKIDGKFTAIVGSTGTNAPDVYQKIEDTSAGGTGRVNVTIGGVLDVSSSLVRSDTLEVQPALNLYFGSKLTLLLNPISFDNHKVVTRGEFLVGQDDLLETDIDEGILAGLPTLDLQIGAAGDKDAVLPLGTQFVLVDYDPNHPPSGFGFFEATGDIGGRFFDGRVFQLGLNQYEIRYSDPEYGAGHDGNDSVITLTVVSVDANDDSYSVVENGRLSVPAPGVLGNDPLAQAPGGAVAMLTSDPGHGTVDLQPDGSFVYIPADDFFGEDTFTYVAVGDTVMSDPAVVHITVNAEETFLHALASLVMLVDGLCADGTLNPGQCNALHVKLAHARQRFLQGNHKTAWNNLSSFQHLVTAFQQGGVLTPGQATSLLQVADLCISLL